jgi:hypothetical protein
VGQKTPQQIVSGDVDYPKSTRNQLADQIGAEFRTKQLGIER